MTGTDVFISYKREERERVRLIVDALKAFGLTVWFDAKLESGSSFDEEINREVRGAKCVLVCWSKPSVASKWVRAEASIGMGREVLAAVFLEPAELMPPYNLIHTVSLADWDGAEDHPAWLDLVERIGKLCGREDLRALSEQKGKAGRVAREEAKARREFEAALTEARNRFHAMHETRPVAFERDMAQASVEFEQWLEARRAGRKANRPDPLALVESNAEVLRHDLEVAERERLAAAALVARYKAELQRDGAKAPVFSVAIPVASPASAIPLPQRLGLAALIAVPYVFLEAAMVMALLGSKSDEMHMRVQTVTFLGQLAAMLLWSDRPYRPDFGMRMLVFWPVFLILAVVTGYVFLLAILGVIEIAGLDYWALTAAACLKLQGLALIHGALLGWLLNWWIRPPKPVTEPGL